MIVDCAVYQAGKRREGSIPLEHAAAASRRKGAFVWLGVAEPSAEEFESIAREFDLHELAVEDAIKAHQRPKAELYDDTLLVVVKTAHYIDSDEVIQIGELIIFVNRKFVVTVRHGRGPLTEVRARAEHRPDLLVLGTGAVLYAIIDHVVDDYEVAAGGIDVDVQEVEKQVFSQGRANPAERIYKLEREVLDFYQAVAPLTEAVGVMSRGHYEELVPEPLHEYYRDVHDHLRRVNGRISSFRDLLSSALQANLTQVSVRQNDDMRRISAWVAILAIPTMIAGIYGMNFDNIPELHWKYGYPTVLVLTLAICGTLYWRFKRAGWL